jgi:putative endonuclease
MTLRIEPISTNTSSPPGLPANTIAINFFTMKKLSPLKEALHREKELKRYLRTWKFNLIKKMNPKFEDLYQDLAPIEPFNNAGKKSKK